jgi:drug/metabolite transporter (DMT)-like permease
VSSAALLGLVAAVLWGVADLLIRSVSRRLGVTRAMVWCQAPTLTIATAALLFLPQARAAVIAAPPDGWAYGLLAGAFSLVASVGLYRALSGGTLALVAPIAASYAAVTAALSLLTGRESLTPGVGGGLAVCCAGVALASWGREPGEDRLPGWRAALSGPTGWALLSSAGYGAAFYVQGVWVVPRLGPWIPVAGNALLVAAAVSAVALATRRSLAPPDRRTAPRVLACGVLALTAFAAYLSGLQSGAVAVVTVLSSLAGAVAVLLALVFLRERLAPRQWAGVAAALAGVVLINAG